MDAFAARDDREGQQAGDGEGGISRHRALP